MNIGSNIKKLRRERDITQEQLAEYLNISVSAISQWECEKTAPDISLLAPLANILNVSADVLLGIDVTDKEKQIQDIVSNAEKIYHTDCEKAISILREGLKEYPNSFTIMERLMCFIKTLHNTTNAISKDEALILLNEVIKLGEKILAECTDDKCRFWALNTLCRAYSEPEIGMTEKAIELAEKLPNSGVTRESLLAELYEGEKKIKQLRENMQRYFGELIMSMNDFKSYYFTGKEESEEYIAVNKKMAALIEIMLEDENYGFFVFMMGGCCSALARNYAKLNDYDKAIEYLKRSADNAIKIDTEYERRPRGPYRESTSLLLKGTQGRYTFNNDETFSIHQLEQMKHTAFDPIRERKEFKEIEENLKNMRRKD